MGTNAKPHDHGRKRKLAKPHSLKRCERKQKKKKKKKVTMIIYN